MVVYQTLDKRHSLFIDSGDIGWEYQKKVVDFKLSPGNSRGPCEVLRLPESQQATNNR